MIALVAVGRILFPRSTHVTRLLYALVAAAALTAGCAGFPGFTDSQGTLAGTAGGATVGSIAGDTGWGATVGGNTYDKRQKAQP